MAVVVGTLALAAVNAKADFITGYGWVTTESLVRSATGATVASLALPTCHNGAGACTMANADVTFTTTGLNVSATGATVAQWLASSTFTLNNLVDNVPTSLMDPTIWEFVGNISVASPNPYPFTVLQDDGLTFVVNGQTISGLSPGPTAPTTTNVMYTGPANSNAPFSLIYTECCGGPSVLQIGVMAPPTPNPVPEPGSIVLLGTVMGGSAFLWRRRNARRN